MPFAVIDHVVVDLVRHHHHVGKIFQAGDELVYLRLGVTPPVGLAGELTMSSRVCGVISLSVSSAENAKLLFSSRIGTGIGRAPVYSIIER